MQCWRKLDCGFTNILNCRIEKFNVSDSSCNLHSEINSGSSESMPSNTYFSDLAQRTRISIVIKNCPSFLYTRMWVLPPGSV
jgi:hypothetical protein